MATVPPLPAAQTLAPTTYCQLYQSLCEPTNGAYQHLYNGHHPTTGSTAAELLAKAVSSSNCFPQVYLVRIRLPNNSTWIIAIHCPSRFEANLLEPQSSWNNWIVAFIGDYNNTARFVKTITLLATAFEATAVQTVTLAADMGTRYAATKNNTIGPNNSGDPNTQDIESRMLVPFPPP